MTAVAIGDRLRLAGYALAGVDVRAAASREEVRAHWEALEPDVGLLILTPAAYDALAESLSERRRLVWAVLPA